MESSAVYCTFPPLAYAIHSQDQRRVIHFCAPSMGFGSEQLLGEQEKKGGRDGRRERSREREREQSLGKIASVLNNKDLKEDDTQ